jgi:hypothetical protein
VPPAVELGRSATTARLDDEAAVADDRDVGPAVLADLGRVDVGVDDLGVRGEASSLAGDPVVEAGAEAMSRSDFCIAVTAVYVAVHARHAEVLRVAVGERAARHQRGDDGMPVSSASSRSSSARRP